MHGAQHSGALFFYLNGKDNNYKNSVLLLDEDAPVNPYTNNVIPTANMDLNVPSSPKTPKLPMIANSITDNALDPGAIIMEMDIDTDTKVQSDIDLDHNHKYHIHKEHSDINKTGHCKNLHECLHQNMDQHPPSSLHCPISQKSLSLSLVSNIKLMQSSQISIDCDAVLDVVPKISVTNCCNRSNQNNSLKNISIDMNEQHGNNKSIFAVPTTTHNQLMPHPNMELDMYCSDQIKNIQTNTLNLPSKRKYSLDVHHHPNHHNNDWNSNINLKAFEPDLLNIDRKDNNSYRDEDICDDENWWMSGAYFDDAQLEFLHDPHFIYYGIKI